MIEIEVEEEAWLTAAPSAEDWVRRAATTVLQRPEAADFLGADDPDVDVTVLLADDDAVADLNSRFLGKPGPTNVLSFPAPDSARPHLGDVILAYGVCVREAEGQGKTLDHHLAHLTVHGVLHLLGWDHLTDAEADVMEGLERDILAGLGVPDPYAVGASDG